MSHVQPYLLSEETAIVLKLQARLSSIHDFWNLKTKQTSFWWRFPSCFLEVFRSFYLCLFVGKFCWNCPLSADNVGWVSLDRLMKIVASKMSQNNHLQSDHYKSKHFLAGCLSHGLIWQSRFLLVQHLLVR